MPFARRSLFLLSKALSVLMGFGISVILCLSRTRAYLFDSLYIQPFLLMRSMTSRSLLIPGILLFCFLSSVDRLLYMNDLAKAWKGPFSLSIFLMYQDIGKLSQWIERTTNITNLRLSIYLAVPPDKTNNYINIPMNKRDVTQSRRTLLIYPINYLRDLAIMNVRTTHYLNMDMDLWPSCSSSNLLLCSHNVFQFPQHSGGHFE